MKKNLLLLLIALIACDPMEFTPDFDQKSVSGYKPIYVDSSDFVIRSEAARPISTAGKIYSYGQLLLVNEVGTGIHVYDNSDPKNPENLFFVTIPGNHDMAVKEGILYADNYNDLVSLRVSQDAVVELKRIPEIIAFSPEHPIENNVYFECVDQSLGKVVGWELTTLHKPQCYRP